MIEERGTILDEAKAIINGERQNTYGDPEDSFSLIADYWNVYINKIQRKMLIDHGVDPRDYELLPMLHAKDIAMMMTLFKIAREQEQGNRDNIRDASGYLGIAGDMQNT
jgi:hypothetical protein